MAAPPLDQQPGNYRGLEQQGGDSGADRQAILFPWAGGAEVNLAPGREPTFTDAPALQLPPVVLWGFWLDWRRIDACRRFSAQNAHGGIGSLLADRRNRNQRPPDDPLSQKDVAIAKDRRVS